MRILLLSPFLPDRAAPHGGGIYLATLAQALAQHAEVGLVAILRPEEEDRLRTDPTPWRWTGTVPLRERPTGKGRRRHQLRMLWRWRQLPLVAAKYWDPRAVTTIQRALREFAPDVVCVELAQMAQYLPFLRHVPTILTDHEAGCPANTTTGLGRWGDARDRRLWARYVQTFYPQASLVQAVTNEDAEALAKALERPVLVRPPTFAVPQAPVAPGRTPPRVLFLGDYAHQPNPEAAAVLAREVLPRLRTTVPETELWLAGPHEERIQELASLPGVKVLGYVQDLHHLFGQVRFLLAPLFSGGGFRVKSLAALAHGLPVVTNGLGARGCSAPHASRRIVEGSEALAAACLDWLQSPQQAGEAGRAAFAWAQQNLTGDAIARTQIERAQALVAAARDQRDLSS
jgi:glycosyltransferase involved in cell wall biosynthesis